MSDRTTSGRETGPNFKEGPVPSLGTRVKVQSPFSLKTQGSGLIEQKGDRVLSLDVLKKFSQVDSFGKDRSLRRTLTLTCFPLNEDAVGSSGIPGIAKRRSIRSPREYLRLPLRLHPSSFPLEDCRLPPSKESPLFFNKLFLDSVRRKMC